MNDHAALTDEQHRLHLRAAQDYEALYRLFIKGSLSEAEFRQRRQFFGVHSRSSPGRVMVRLKPPMGRLGGGHWRCAADLARRYCPSASLHVTTGQCLQFYDVPLEDSPGFLRTAAEGGFGVAAAGGRTVRPLTLPAGTGLGPEEAFDPTWVAALFQLRLDADEALRGLPGSLRIGFWRSLHDEESEPGNDVSILPVRRQVGTRLRRGFRLLLGGGLGTDPSVEVLWKAFVPPEDLYATLRALILHFKGQGGREKPHPRLRHLLHREGWPAFQSAIEQLLLVQPRDRAATFFHHLGLPKAEEPAAAVLRGNCLAGCLDAAQCEGLADLAQRYGDGLLRLSTRQQIWLGGVPPKRAREAWEGLCALGLAGPFEGTFSACPSGKACGHAQVETRQVYRLVLSGLREALGEQEGAATAGLKLGVSGCKDGCGHHRSADLGFEGLEPQAHDARPRLKVYGRPAGDPRGLASEAGTLAVASLPELLKGLVADFRASAAPDLASFLRQLQGWQSLQRHLGALGQLPDPEAPEA